MGRNGALTQKQNHLQVLFWDVFVHLWSKYDKFFAFLEVSYLLILSYIGFYQVLNCQLKEAPIIEAGYAIVISTELSRTQVFCSVICS